MPLIIRFFYAKEDKKGDRLESVPLLSIKG
jgi:hypothetical protein